MVPVGPPWSDGWVPLCISGWGGPEGRLDGSAPSLQGKVVLHGLSWVILLHASLPGPKLLGALTHSGGRTPILKDPLFTAPGPVLLGMWGLPTT